MYTYTRCYFYTQIYLNGIRINSPNYLNYLLKSLIDCYVIISVIKPSINCRLPSLVFELFLIFLIFVHFVL